jgi:hypothetical protein
MYGSSGVAAAPDIDVEFTALIPKNAMIASRPLWA